MKTIPTLFGEQVVPEPRREYNGQFKDEPHCDGLPQEMVKRHLERGMSITVRQCWKLYGSSELRRIISRLRKTMNITSTPYIENGRVAYHIYKLSKNDKPD